MLIKMWNLRVICLFVTVIAFVSPPSSCHPHGSSLQAQNAPIIFITAPLLPGEVVVLGDETPSQVIQELKDGEIVPIKNEAEAGSEVPIDDRKPQKPKPQKPKPQKPKPQKPKPKPQKPRPQRPSGKPQKPSSGSGRPQKPGGSRPQRPGKPQKPGRPQAPGQRPQRPQRPPVENELKTETTTMDYEYASTIEPEYSEEVVTTPLPDFAVPSP